MVPLLRTVLGGHMVIYHSETFTDFVQYCQPTYKFTRSGSQLKKLLVVFRHHDRTPLYAEGSEWQKRNCISCNSHHCRINKCRSMQLTLRGYEQGVLFGKYIKSYYGEELGPRLSVMGAYAPTDLALSSFKSVLNGMQMNYAQSVAVPALLPSTDCEDVKKQHLNSSTDFLDSKQRQQGGDYARFDTTMTSLCSDVPIACEKPSCNLIEMKGHLTEIQMQFEDQMAKTKENIIVNGLEFAPLAKLLRTRMQGEETVGLLAGDTSAVFRVMNGLNAALHTLPSYGAAAFIEVWANEGGEETVRLVYEGVAQRFGFDSGTSMSRASFMEYLEMFADKTDAINKICKLGAAENADKRLSRLFKKNAGKLNDFLSI